MRVSSNLLQDIHLDKTYSLLTGRNLKIILELFKMLDVHNTMALNDIQFYCFMRHVTNIDKKKIYKVFDMLDVDGSGEMDFDEFYLLMCILIAIKDNQEKQFIYRHSRTVFELLDEDGSASISADEFENFGFLFNFHGDAVKGIFKEFDVSGDQELDYKEFKMFAMAAIDKQNELDRAKRQKIEDKRHACMMKQKKLLLKDLQDQGLLPDKSSRKDTELLSPSTATTSTADDMEREKTALADLTDDEYEWALNFSPLRFCTIL